MEYTSIRISIRGRVFCPSCPTKKRMFKKVLPPLEKQELVQTYHSSLGAADYTLKLIVIGEASVGKTSLISRFVHDQFDSVYKPTLGFDFAVKSVELGNGATAKINIWDTTVYYFFLIQRGTG